MLLSSGKHMWYYLLSLQFLLDIGMGFGTCTIGSDVMWELALEAVTLLYQRSKSDLGILGSLVHNIIRGSDSGDKE